MKIGFIGFGEAAFNISLGLKQEGITGIRANDALMHDPVMGPQVSARAEEAAVTLEESQQELVQWADVLFAAVPSSYTLDVCSAVKGALRPGQLYVDVSASTPKTKESVWALVKDTGVLFVDAAMMGSLPKDKHKVPITASGNGAKAFQERMTPWGMKITCSSEKPGDASAIKLVRSIYMKGVAALMIEMLQAGDAYGVADQVVETIAKSMDGIPFRDHLDRLVTGTAIHCVRRAAELKGSIAMEEEAGVATEMTSAAKHGHEALAPYAFAKKYALAKPAGWQEIIEAIRPEI